MTSPLTVVAYAYDTGGFTTRSDYFRAHSEAVAQAACLGLLTTQRLDGTFGNVWRPSPLGLTLLFKDVQSHEITIAALHSRPRGDCGPSSTRIFGDTYSG
jgi:hypothetical protein